MTCSTNLDVPLHEKFARYVTPPAIARGYPEPEMAPLVPPSSEGGGVNCA